MFRQTVFGTLLIISVLFLGSLTCTPGHDGDDKTDIKSIALGTELPMQEHKMKGVDGQFHTLKNFNGDQGTLVIFSACSCPFVIGSDENEGWEARYNGVFDLAQKNNVGMVLVNANEAKRKGADSFENMKKRAKNHKYKMSYLYDTHHKLADAFGAKFTPHVFLFDKNNKLVYKGAIDDNVRSPEAVDEHYLHNALKAIGSGKEIKTKESRAIGCSIKRK